MSLLIKQKDLLENILDEERKRSLFSLDNNNDCGDDFIVVVVIVVVVIAAAHALFAVFKGRR
jgi:hypothetical protein